MLVINKLGAVSLAVFLSVQGAYASDAPGDGGSGGSGSSSSSGVTSGSGASASAGGQRTYGNRRPTRAAQEQAATAQGLVLSDDICNGGKYDPCGDDAGRIENR